MQPLLAEKVGLVSLQMEVLQEIRRQLAPYLTCGVPITGETVISDGATIDSLTVMDMVMELEDRFDVAIPMNVVAEIRTVDELADTIIRLKHP
ncbi:MAG TPA: acyl carrier protein [Reyranella sp.]|nr:acyl carrier protein [Reyranella sp.]